MNNVLKVGYLLPAERRSEEDAAVLAWLREDALDLRGVPVSPSRLVEDLDVLWVHFPTQAAYEAVRPNTPLCASIRSYLEQGGRLLLTDFAAYLPHDLGIETHRPEARQRAIEDAGYGRGYGFQSFRGHPLLDAFHGGLYLWQADEDHIEERVGYFDAAWPVQGRVVGVEKSYIRLHPANKLLVEHVLGAGRLLSVGAFIHFAPKNHRASPTRHFIRHALHRRCGIGWFNPRGGFHRSFGTTRADCNIIARFFPAIRKCPAQISCATNHRKREPTFTHIFTYFR